MRSTRSKSGSIRTWKAPRGSGTEFELGIVEQRYDAVKEVVGARGP
jgi:hypothetical protein